MSAPTTYSEAGLATFMVEILDDTGEALGLTVASTAITRQVTFVERLLNVSDVATLTNMGKLEAIATWRAWLVALGAAASGVDLKAGSAQIWLSQRFPNLLTMLREAERAVLIYPEVAAIVGGFAPLPYAGGLSRADKAARESDPDRVSPFWTRALHEAVATFAEVD